MPKASKETASRVEDIGTEVIEFSPTDEYGKTTEVLAKNLETMRDA